MRRVRLRNHQKPRGALVEPVHDSGPSHSSDAGEACAAMGNQRIDERSRFMSGRRMHHEPGRLVDDEQIFVLEDNFERDVFAQRRRIGGRGKAQASFGLPGTKQKTRGLSPARRRLKHGQLRSGPSLSCAINLAQRPPPQENGRASRRHVRGPTRCVRQEKITFLAHAYACPACRRPDQRSRSTSCGASIG